MVTNDAATPHHQQGVLLAYDDCFIDDRGLGLRAMYRC